MILVIEEAKFRTTARTVEYIYTIVTFGWNLQGFTFKILNFMADKISSRIFTTPAGNIVLIISHKTETIPCNIARC